jgi:cyclin B
MLSMMSEEGRCMPKYPFAFHEESQINERMRAKLFAWLNEVHLKFKLLPETLFTTTNLVDRFSQLCPITRSEYQLVGVTSMLIASKIHEVHAPVLGDFTFITDNAYSEDQIRKKEHLMLSALDFDVTFPTPRTFMDRFLVIQGMHDDKSCSDFCYYIIELLLLDSEILKFSPSLTAMGAIYLVRKILGHKSLWDTNLHGILGFKERAVRDCARVIVRIVNQVGTPPSEQNRFCSTYRKYALAEYSRVAYIPQ